MIFFQKMECRICGSGKSRTGERETLSLRARMEQYSRADQAERLCLWLQHRDLRREFDELEGMNKS